jgi:putative ABC transport system permease protein
MDFVFVIPWTAILAAFLTSFMVAITMGLYLQLKPQLDPIELYVMTNH